MRLMIFSLMIPILTLGAIFSPPVDTVRVTSTFGEFRQMGSRGPHFHMGVDFSTALSSGKPVYAAADGYLVRIEIDEDDIYGYTLVLDHGNGYRTLYAHMSAFSPKLSEIVQDLKKEFGKNRIVVEFPEGEIYFKKGEIVGFSGQTGEATWPHVHFEVRNAQETVSYDPIPLLSGLVKPPDEDIVVEAVSVDGKVFGSNGGFTATFRGDYPKIEILAYSRGFSNKLGLKRISLYFNDEEVYRISFDEIPWNEFNDVYSVYGERSRMSEYVFKPWYALYPRSETSLVKMNELGGKFPRSINVRVELEDVWGMVRSISFKVRRGM